MGLYGFSQITDPKTMLLEKMREAGADRLEASYSGGNDEGGVGSIKLFFGEEEVPVPEMWITRDPVGDERSWSSDGKVHEYHPLYQAADDMLALDFGSWAGEFSAYGTLFATLSDRRVWREGEIQSGYDSDGRDY